MKLIMAKMIWHFDLEVSERNVGKWNDQKVYLLNEKTPFWVKIRARV